jgi:peptidoglycan hydrolase-like protein with peptidoglycan-binding domain
MCTPAAINETAYRDTARDVRTSLHLALQCLLKQQGLYTRSVTGTWNAATTTAVKAWQARVHHRVEKVFTRSDWTSLLAAGTTGSVLQAGVRNADVVRAQRALNAAISPHLQITGAYNKATRAAVRAYQQRVGISPTGVVATKTWAALRKGRR